MTNEKIMKANELIGKIKNMTERLEMCQYANGSALRRNNGTYGEIPITDDLKRVINVLVTDNIKKQLQALTEELEAL